MRRRLFLFLAILGPGLISAIAGNDAGGTATYSVIGASFGYQMLWMLLFVAVGLAVIQEMCARMGVVTGKGLSDLIREEFGLRWTFFAMLVLLVANFAVTVAEFAGIAASFEIFGITRYLAIPIMALIIWGSIVRGSYKTIERVFIGICFIYFSYVISGIMAKPDWIQVARHTFVPSFHFTHNFILLLLLLLTQKLNLWQVKL